MAQITVASLNNESSPVYGQHRAVQADNGNLLHVVPFSSGTLQFYFSANKGSTWTLDTGGSISASQPRQPTLAILGGHVWVMWQSFSVSTYFLYWKHGTLNAGRTAVTWDAGTTTVDTGGNTTPVYNGGMVVHAEGSGFKCHIHHSEGAATSNRAIYRRYSLNSDGTFLSSDTGTSWAVEGAGQSSSECAIHLDPATKDIFLIAEIYEAGNDYYLFQKRAYTSATWPAGTTRTLKTVTHVVRVMDTAFDGERIIVAGFDPASNDTPFIVERDKADTTTTTRTPPSGVANATDNYSNLAISVDASDDITLVFTDNSSSGDPSDVYKNVYDRSANTWSGTSLVIDTTFTAFSVPDFIEDTGYLFGSGLSGGSNQSALFLSDLIPTAYSAAALLQGVATFTGSPTFTLTGSPNIPRPIIEIAFASNPVDMPVWTDVTDYVESFNVRRGRQRELDRFEPGSLSLVLDNDDRRFDPTNTASPYYPNVVPVRRIRVRAIFDSVVYDVFQGFVSGWPQEYPFKGRRQTVSLEAVDASGYLAFANADASRPEELTGARIAATLDAAKWPAADRDLDPGVELLAAAEFDLDQPALALIQEIGVLELGRVFATKDGKIKFTDRSHLYESPTLMGTWSDTEDGTDNSYENLVPSEDEGEIYNHVDVNIPGQEPFVSEDEDSQNKYFLRHFHQEVDLASDSQAEARAEFILERHKEPQIRFTRMDLDPRVDGAYDAALALELGDQITVERTPSGGGPTISQVVAVDEISHDVNRDDKSWSISLALTPTQTLEDFWILGTSVLGTDTKLGY